MATQATLGKKLSKAWKAARKPLDLDTANQVLLSIQSALSIYRVKNCDDQDQLPEIGIGLDCIKVGADLKQTKGTDVAVHGVSRLGSAGSMYCFCSGKSMDELDKIQAALVHLTGAEHKDEIKELVIDARNRVYAGNPVMRFMNKFQNPGHEIAA